ncbi:saccharopine dehydrogenase family protein [Actinophytocola sp.]|uniref:saccharopine dehydrogenase family protein n=1 Tax=Actinophytocola sp. TaxID=1872138 RepID=UPI002D3725E4|nr:NAD(P)H-binding protein [Actinophytocola sp.]HYQ69847.1 NAD(P)H-binding protein [Actinophytocola sp.]
MKIAVYGASGFTGRLVVAELAHRGIGAVLVGRDAERLQRVADAEVRQAPLEHAALVRAFRGCAAVINCAGPFSLLGEPVLRAADAASCHYVDIAGEQTYLARLFEGPGPDVSAVPGVNDDGLPSDLLAHLVAGRVGSVRELVIGLDLVRGGGAPSRGTLRSALANLDTFTAGGLGYADGRWDPDLPARRTTMAFLGAAVPVVKFPLPAVVTVPHHVAAGRVEGVARPELVAGFAGVTPELVEQLPEGPAESHRRAGRWIIAVEAVGDEGRARGVVHGADTYGTTAVTAVEAARRLVADGAAPGLLAPAQAFDAADFLAFLETRGVTVDGVRPPRSRSSSAGPRDRT